MKRLLSIIGAISLVGTSTTSLVACNKPQEYTKEQLEQLKKENKINTTYENIKNNLEWIAPQEKPFNTVDNKYYYVVWKKSKWEVNKIFRNYNIDVGKEYNIYKDNNYELKFFKGITSTNKIKDVSIFYSSNNPIAFRRWGETNSDYINYIKSVYRWNGEENKLPDLITNKDGNLKVNVE
ncbi:MAG: lipoprotein [Spiroplasma phoeniceum]|nr:MAG: lipoprotein [Spiroplasma phoeniceum]UZQ31824.1 MAG: lipoprotein [Spiroplasma phoeniceum]